MTGWKTRLIHFHEGEGKGPFKGSLKARINHVPRALPSLDWYRRGWKRGHGTRVVAGVSKIMADVCRARQCRVHRWGNKKKGGNKTENEKKRAKLSISESFFAMLSRLSKRIVERGLNGDSLSRDLAIASRRRFEDRSKLVVVGNYIVIENRDWIVRRRREVEGGGREVRQI